MDSGHSANERPDSSILRRGSVLAVALWLVACQAATSSPSAQPATESADPSLPAPSATEAPEDPLEELYNAALEEGTFSVYGNADPPYVAALFEAFSARYPGIEGTSVQQSAGDTVQQVQTAIAAGQPSPADIMLTKFQFARPLYEQGEIDTSTDWEAYGVPEEVLSPIEGGVEEIVQPFGLAYDTNIHQPEDLPTSWEGLVDSEWRGQLAICSTGLPFDVLSVDWGADATVDYIERLLEATDARIIEGCFTPQLLALLAGEVSLTPAPFYATEQFKQEGGPIDWIPLDPIPVDRTTWFLVAESEHLNAARLFVAWQTGPEAQEIAEEFLRSNVLSACCDLPADYELVFPTSPEEHDVTADASTRLRELLAGLAQ